MIRCTFKFGDDEPVDSYDAFKFIYMDSDNVLHAPMKAEEKTSYANEQGEHTTAKYVEDAFDYKMRFAIVTSGYKDKEQWANRQIAEFIKSSRETTASGLPSKKTVVYVNFYKGVRVTGILSKVEVKDFFRTGNQDECVQVEVTLRVPEPGLCVFDYYPPSEDTPESCFSQGYWDGSLPWGGYMPWKKILILT